MDLYHSLSRAGTINVLTMTPKDPELKKEYQEFKTDSTIRAFKLVTSAGFAFWFVFGLATLISGETHLKIFFLKHTLDCILWILIWCISKRWKKSVAYLASCQILTHFILWTYFMGLAEKEKEETLAGYGLKRENVVLTHELSFFFYLGYELLISPSMCWSVCFMSPVYIFGVTYYDS